MADIKLFVCCHKQEEVPRHPLLYPLQVGASLSDVRFPGFLCDDTGENISEKNRSYCELTAQYWAWKNIRADYYGFFHYRRYLYPDTTARQPYQIKGRPSIELLERLRFSALEELIPQYDLILPKSEDMHLSVWEHYANAPHHHGKDLELTVQILLKAHPGYRAAAVEYLSGSGCYFGNILVMKREVFQDYCAWLFPLLAEFDRLADTGGYGPQEQRVDGYLAERLLGVYVIQLQKKQLARVLELPRVHFIPEAGKRLKKQLVNIVLPPGTKHRAVVKRWSKHG